VEFREDAMELGLYMLEKECVWLMSGEPTGEKPKFCWKGPAEDIIGSSLSWKVSIAKGTWGWVWWKPGVCIG
jgi:hypothetical protein